MPSSKHQPLPETARSLTKATPAGKKLALKIEQMWETLATEHRAWDVLEAVTSRRWKLGRLYDEYTRAHGNVADLRRRLNDVDLATLRDGFLAVYDKQVRNEDTRKRMRRHLADLFETPLFASAATHELLTARLYEYGDVSPNTLRTVHASWSEFFDYALHVKHVVPNDPMDRVPRPPRERLPPRFYELPVIQQIVAWQPTEKRKALMAAIYGTGLEISVALAITRGDIDPSKEKHSRARHQGAHARPRRRLGVAPFLEVRQDDHAHHVGHLRRFEPLDRQRLAPAHRRRRRARVRESVALGRATRGLEARDALSYCITPVTREPRAPSAPACRSKACKSSSGT